MRYKGRTAYQTITGGFIYLLGTCLVTWYTITQVIQLIQRSDPEVVKNTVFHDGDDLGIKTAKELNFDLGFGIFTKDGGTQILDIEGYGSFNMYQFSYESRELKTHLITLKPCIETGGKMGDYFEDESISTAEILQVKCLEPDEATFRNFL